VDPTLATQSVFAYETVWAIGTGKAATPEAAIGVLWELLRPALAGLSGTAVASAIRIQYESSLTAGNACASYSMPEIDGALLGGASLKVEEGT